jgi:uncharacterized protein DUF1573
MSDDFGTVNVRRGERAREIELLRQHYRDHREALVRMTSEAPTEYLAGEYQRLIRDIDTALAKIDEIEGRRTAVDDLNTEPGSRTLITPTPPPHAVDATPANGSRMMMMVVAGVIVLALIGYLIYRASDRGPKTTTAITETVATESGASTTTAPATIEPVTAAPAASSALAVSPAVADYGTIRKGTRATRQIEVTNGSGAPMPFKVSRSQCKCLFYEYKDTIPAKGKETITVTIDGARAKPGSLQETIDVTSKKDPSATASFQVSATIK